MPPKIIRVVADKIPVFDIPSHSDHWSIVPLVEQPYEDFMKVQLVEFK